MDTIDKKYNVKINTTTTNYHKSRRMFCIYKGKLKIAPIGAPYSHAQWFVKEGWMTQEEDFLMDEIVRGYVSKEGDIYFYIGYDFRVDKGVEDIFFKYLDELVESLNLNKDTLKVYGGSKIENGVWKPRKEYDITF